VTIVRPEVRQFADEVRQGLTTSPKKLNPKCLYDSLGSAIFDAICCLPWYRITRAENELLSRKASKLVDTIGAPIRIIELGCGSGEKTVTLLKACQTFGQKTSVHLIDISSSALAWSEQRLREFEKAFVVTHQSDYEEGMQAASAYRQPEETLLLMFLGSSLGNLGTLSSIELLQKIRKNLRVGDALLLGVDLVKPEEELLKAYDDPLGVTAAFNRNVLLRINTELGGNFNLDHFKHRIIWNHEAARIEMHLVSTENQEVLIPLADCNTSFTVGESIWTESSHKFEIETIVDLVEKANFCSCEQWIDQEARFALTLFTAA
jgi:L-histidine N-alpha-methyltransferase